MKIGVIKLGARISFSSQGTSGGTGEAVSIIKMLEQGGADIKIITKILSKDELPDQYSWCNLSDTIPSILESLQSLDALVVINGTVQFYGGQEDREQLLNYAIINQFKGPVFYILCDPELTLSQVWHSVEKKSWAANWRQADLLIARDDIVYISQPHDVEKVVASLGKNEIKPAKIIHYPFEKFPCLNDRLPFNPSPKVDLSYGGTMRGGKRLKKMVKFYFGHPSHISVEMFGKITEEDFDTKYTFGLRPPSFTGPVKYAEMLPKMNDAMAHCVIGDPWYEEINDVPQRLYESVMSQVVTFVDSDMDKIRRIWKADKQLADFLYVKDRAELTEKIELLKLDSCMRKEIIDSQFKAVGFNSREYCNEFVTLIKKLS